jgi:hypothetical protein
VNSFHGFDDLVVGFFVGLPAKDCALNRGQYGQPAAVGPRICCDFCVTFLGCISAQENACEASIHGPSRVFWRCRREAERWSQRAEGGVPAMKACPMVDFFEQKITKGTKERQATVNDKG